MPRSTRPSRPLFSSRSRRGSTRISRADRMPGVVTLAKFLAAAALILYIARQCRKPSSMLGRRLARVMNASHEPLTRWGLSHVAVGASDKALDVGCGGGRTIETLALAAPEGSVAGVDYSPASVAVARERNRAAIDQGRVEIHEASVSS